MPGLKPYINYEEEIRELVSRTKLSVNVMDRWKWSTLEYTVKEAYKVIIEGMALGEGQRNAYDTAWNRLVPLKVSVFVWRLLQNKLPTRDSLIKRGILDVSQNSCPFGCGKEENANHIFFECLIAMVAWSEILRWLSLSSVFHNSIVLHFHQFAGLLRCGRVSKDRPSVIWFVCIWVLWRMRNEKVFRRIEGGALSFIEDIQLIAWKWIKSKAHGFNYAFYQWVINPKECLGW